MKSCTLLRRSILGPSMIAIGLSTACAPDIDADGFIFPEDCNPFLDTVYPGSPEICDGLDQNCDGVADEGLTQTYYPDRDLDGYGNPDAPIDACSQPPGYITENTDCNDFNPLVHPGATELCYDGQDNNCNGSPDSCEFSGSTPLSEAMVKIIGEIPLDQAGVSLASGDIDQNGLDDVIVGAYLNDGGGEQSGAAYVTRSPMLVAETLLTADTQVVGDGPLDLAGFDVSAGDVNADGYADLLVGAYGADVGSIDFTGAAYLFYGPTASDYLAGDASVVFIGESPAEALGFSVSCAGDANGDGYNDVLLGAPSDFEGGPGAGAAYLFYGPLEPGIYNVSAADAKLVGEDPADLAGTAVAFAGDVNNDGVGDLLIGAYGDEEGAGEQSGAAYVLFGPVEGMVNLAQADVKLMGESAFDEAGFAVSAAGDVNQDGVADIVIGAPLEYDDGKGAAYLVYGPIRSGKRSLGTVSVKLVGEETGSVAGIAVSHAGDVNRDGYSDILVSDNLENTAGIGAGAVYLLYGPVPTGVHVLGSLGAKFTGEGDGELAGSAIESAGDINGDGYGDFMVSALFNSLGYAIGGVYVFFGKGI